jgi:NAD(P)H-dependent flavin oxidoreductase YrpB (nitropropane dioxygenase family)
MKVALDFEHMTAGEFIEYAEACGWVLARAHSRSGDPGVIAGYLGKSDAFDRAIGEFAHRSADRNEADHAALVKAVSAGRVRAEEELAGPDSKRKQ